MRAVGDRVFVSLAVGSEKEAFFQVLTFKDGRIVRMEDFDRRDKAIKAAGLPG